MIAASRPVQRPPDARLLHIDARGNLRHLARANFVDLLRPADVVVANDAATLPASLPAVHVSSGAPIEIRLAGRASLSGDDVRRFTAVMFGEGDFRTRTEHRAAPPALKPGERLLVGPLHVHVVRMLGHPRLVEIEFDGSVSEVWAGLAHHGQPIQYAHMPEALALWDVWTPIAAVPVAFEPPSASFTLDWHSLSHMRERGVRFATLTHAAGISSTGDPALDAELPFDEPYYIPEITADAIETAHAKGGRVIAIGTTVVRALEHAGRSGSLRAGNGMATQRIGPHSHLRIVDAILSGTHEADSSHYRLLGAFATADVLERADCELASQGYRTHEFGDSVLIERQLTRSHGTRSERERPRPVLVSH